MYTFEHGLYHFFRCCDDNHETGVSISCYIPSPSLPPHLPSPPSGTSMTVVVDRNVNLGEIPGILKVRLRSSSRDDDEEEEEGEDEEAEPGFTFGEG